MKTTQRGFFTEEQWETFVRNGGKVDQNFLDQVVKRWEEAADCITELEAQNAKLREALEKISKGKGRYNTIEGDV